MKHIKSFNQINEALNKDLSSFANDLSKRAKEFKFNVITLHPNDPPPQNREPKTIYLQHGRQTYHSSNYTYDELLLIYHNDDFEMVKKIINYFQLSPYDGPVLNITKNYNKGQGDEKVIKQIRGALNPGDIFATPYHRDPHSNTFTYNSIHFLRIKSIKTETFTGDDSLHTVSWKEHKERK